jgi:hypothetical protein
MIDIISITPSMHMANLAFSFRLSRSPDSQLRKVFIKRYRKKPIKIQAVIASWSFGTLHAKRQAGRKIHHTFKDH